MYEDDPEAYEQGFNDGYVAGYNEAIKQWVDDELESWEHYE